MKTRNKAASQSFPAAGLLKSAAIGLTISFLTIACAPTEAAKESIPENDFYKQRAAFIATHSKNDNVFSALKGQIEHKNPESAQYWQWRIDQYMYGQYPEYQPIYDAFKAGREFEDIYPLVKEDFGAKKPLPDSLPALPEGHFTENLPGNPHRGWQYLDGDTLYITYQGHLTDPYITSYNLTSKKWQKPLKAAESTLSKGNRKIDSHGRPIIEMDDKGYLHIVYGGHGGEREDGLNPLSIDTPHAGGRMLHVVSKKPRDISEFEYLDDISPFASYTKSYKMGNGDIYLFTRAGTHKSPWVYYKMPAGSKRFEDPVVITWPTPQSGNPINVDTFYINPLKISDTEIAISFLWHECNFLEYHDKETYARINAYYMRLDTSSGLFYNAQDETIDIPVTINMANEKMLAFDSTDKEETPFGTSPLILEDGKPAVAYEARTKSFREKRMAVFNDGQWQHSLPLPNTVNRTLSDKDNKTISDILSLETLSTDPDRRTGVAIYRDAEKVTHFATVESTNGTNWNVLEEHLALKNTRIQMEGIKDNNGHNLGVILNIKKGASQRLYLWHDGEFQTPAKPRAVDDSLSATAPLIYESFENAGWNAAYPRGFTPGLDSALPKNFMFNQLQTNSAFSVEQEIVRNGKYAAKLHWKHEKPATYNGDPKKLDNVDRKAMFHGFKTSTVLGAEAWYGFSFYFPSDGTTSEPNDWLFFQIHGSADKRLQEHSRNPPFSLTLTEQGMRGNWKWDPYELSPTRNGDGTEHFEILGSKQDYLDRWVDFVLHVKVDYTDARTGLIELWVDGEKVLDKDNIRFGYNDDKGIYPSWGMYFNGDLSGMQNDHYLYLDEIRMTDSHHASYKDVAPN
ncbi:MULTISPECIES: heparin lyase I family protein [unclassified Alteromonas]|uniref:heparin lyase I family protein n=1 Tax=unclassified Alteromonas TaxID=2614992 RepID=UPI0009E08AE4|nr:MULTISPECIES: heparin lyase I family protein [unclassified Alteromonas]